MSPSHALGPLLNRTRSGCSSSSEVATPTRTGFDSDAHPPPGAPVLLAEAAIDVLAEADQLEPAQSEEL